MAVTACFVTRNHASVLPDAMNAAKAVADTLIVADTGSTDDTVTVARDAGATILPLEWANDFSAACQSALDAVATEWVLWLNPDERVVPNGWPDLRVSAPRIATLAYRVRIIHEVRRESPGRGRVDYQIRLFRKHPDLRYVGRLHPRFVPSLDEIARKSGESIPTIDGTIRRLSFLSQVTPEKIRWSIRLLEAELADRPGQLEFEIELGRNLVSLGEVRGHEILAGAAQRVFESNDHSRDAGTVGPLLDYLLTTNPEFLRYSIPRERVRRLAAEWFPHSPPVVWALAMERFASSDYESASGELRRLLEMGRTGSFLSAGEFHPDILGPAATLNLALCCLHLNRLEDASSLLLPLMQDPHWRQDAADVYREVVTRANRPN